MEEILKNSNKVIIDKSAQGGSGVLPYLPLPALGIGGAAAGAPAQGNASGASPSAAGVGQSPAQQSATSPLPPVHGR
jgi:hypothetical protein